MKRAKQLLLWILTVLVAVLAGMTTAAHEFLTPKNPSASVVRVTIERGMRASEVAGLLEQKEIIRHAWSMRLLMRLSKTENRIQAGAYDLSPSASEYQILQKLVRGEVATVRITVPEGFTLRQIARTLGENQVVREEEFLEAARGAKFEIPGLRDGKEGLEGYLFPDTYDFPTHSPPAKVYGKMLDRFRELVLPLYLQSPKRLSLSHTVILASLIEREGKIPSEYPLISAVYYNRLKAGIPLQCDATIQYALGTPRELLSAEDLKIESPYNTYLHPGLPPGPIGSPGLLALKAALSPARAAYLYYVVRGDGGHVFSRTYQEHLRAVERYRQWLYRRDHP